MKNMGYEIEYLPIAISDIAEVEAYLSQFYESTASRVMERLEERISLLSENPKMCQVSRYNRHFRQMVVENYLVFYVVDVELKIVVISRVLRAQADVRNVIGDV